jgi:hypothetical protein
MLLYGERGPLGKRRPERSVVSTAMLGEVVPDRGAKGAVRTGYGGLALELTEKTEKLRRRWSNCGSSWVAGGSKSARRSALCSSG